MQMTNKFNKLHKSNCQRIRNGHFRWKEQDGVGERAGAVEITGAGEGAGVGEGVGKGPEAGAVRRSSRDFDRN